MTPKMILLTLIDKINKITFSVDKTLLVKKCAYFEKLFTYFREKDEDAITIEVPNAQVTYDIILSFSGTKINSGNLKYWLHQLELIKCRAYLGMHSDIPKIVVPAEGFDLLIEVLGIIGYDDDAFKLIDDNLPKDYDITKLSTELINEIIRVNTSHRIIAQCSDKTIKLGNVSTNKWNRMDKLSKKSATYYVYCSNDCSVKFEINTNCIINVLDISTGKCLQSLVAHTSYINTIVYSPNRQQIAAGSSDNLITIWDTVTGKKILTLTGNTEPVSLICYSHDSQNIASLSYDATIKLWNTTTGKLIHTLFGHEILTTCVQYSADDKQIISSGYDGVIKIWDTQSGALIRSFWNSANHITNISYSRDNLRIISGDIYGNTKIWDALKGIFISQIRDDLIEDLKNQISKSNKISESNHFADNVRYHIDEEFIVSSSVAGIITIYNTNTGELMHRLTSNNISPHVQYTSLNIMKYIGGNLHKRLLLN